MANLRISWKSRSFLLQTAPKRAKTRQTRPKPLQNRLGRPLPGTPKSGRFLATFGACFEGKREGSRPPTGEGPKTADFGAWRGKIPSFSQNGDDFRFFSIDLSYLASWPHYRTKLSWSYAYPA